MGSLPTGSNRFSQGSKQRQPHPLVHAIFMAPRNTHGIESVIGSGKRTKEKGPCFKSKFSPVSEE